MKRLALLGMWIGLVPGCPSPHATVRSCDEATTAPDGTACEGFTTCPSGSCGGGITCMGGVVLRVIYECDSGGSLDSGSGNHDAGLDAGPVDAGPCAPHQPTSGATGCHTTSDCDPTRFEMCFAPGASIGCGVCVMAMRTCVGDTDCASTDYCESYVDPCAHPGLCGNGSDVTSTRCTPRCTAASCGFGESCQPDGRCMPISCVGGGFTCPAHTTCSGTSGGDAHGCVRDSCASDVDCGCGAACLMGFCYDTLGSCMAPAA